MDQIAQIQPGDGLSLSLCGKKITQTPGFEALKFRQPQDFAEKSGFTKKMRREVFFALAASGTLP
jgi:glutamine cyclotransferase